MLSMSLEEICNNAILELNLNYNEDERKAFIDGANYMTWFIKDSLEKIMKEKEDAE